MKFKNVFKVEEKDSAKEERCVLNWKVELLDDGDFDVSCNDILILSSENEGDCYLFVTDLKDIGLNVKIRK